MGLFKNNKKVGLIADVIRCDEPSYLIWKWHPDGKERGEHKREYAIRCGSPIRVKDGEVAVFVYKQKDSTIQDYIVGPFDSKLKTANLPVLSGILGAFFGGDTPFQAEVYFINLAEIVQIRFAVPYFDVSDPRHPDFTVPVAVRGSISFKITDYREFIKLHRLDHFNLENFQSQIKDVVCRYVKDTVANAPATHNIPVVQIEAKTSMINDVVETDLKNRLKEDFGVTVSGVDIGAIEIDKTCEDYEDLMRVTKYVTGATVEAKTVADIEDYAEKLRIQREESQYAMHKQTQSANIGAYQIEKQTEVGVAGADALGQMGSNNAGNVNLGETGFNPAAMMASMALGGAVGQNLVNTMNMAMTPTQTPPPVPTVSYYVAVNGQQTGPFDFNTLKQMAANGQLQRTSLVWKAGMSTWAQADSITDLSPIFQNCPPPIPQ